MRRFFGTAEFSDTVGWLTTHDRDALRRAVEACPRPYTGAYMVRADTDGSPKIETIAMYMGALWTAAPKVTEAIRKTRTWEAGYRVLSPNRGVPVYGFGGTGFMAKETLLDYLLWLPWEVDDAATWTPVGPGARRGLCRVLGQPITINGYEGYYIERVQALLEAVQPRWRRAFPKAEPLTAHDVQFCLCEVEKYLRTKNGEGRPRSTYKPSAPSAESLGTSARHIGCRIASSN